MRIEGIESTQAGRKMKDVERLKYEERRRNGCGNYFGRNKDYKM